MVRVLLSWFQNWRICKGRMPIGLEEGWGMSVWGEGCRRGWVGLGRG